MESRDLKRGPAVPVIRDSNVEDFCWLSDGRMIFSIGEFGSMRRDDNLYEISVDPATGIPSGKPRRFTNWAGFNIYDLSATRDGKRLAFLRLSFQSDVYVAALEARSTRITAPRRLTLNEHSDLPMAWTGDSKAVVFLSDRNGKYGVFKQDFDKENAETVSMGPEDRQSVRASGDGAWLFFNVRSKEQETAQRIMRVRPSGGPAELVLEGNSILYIACPRRPQAACVVGEQSADRKQVVFSAFDPLRGRGKSLLAIPVDPFREYRFGLSPDGSTMGLLEAGGREPVVRLLSLSGAPERSVTVKQWGHLNSLDWAADGQGFFITSQSPRGATLLFVDLNGNAHTLWQQKGTFRTWGWAIPSPDGRRIAILGATVNSNAWMLRNF